MYIFPHNTLYALYIHHVLVCVAIFGGSWSAVAVSGQYVYAFLLDKVHLLYRMYMYLRMHHIHVCTYDIILSILYTYSSYNVYVHIAGAMNSVIFDAVHVLLAHTHQMVLELSEIVLCTQ